MQAWGSNQLLPLKEQFIYYGRNVPTLSMFLRPILTVTLVWNTGETGDIYAPYLNGNFWINGLNIASVIVKR